MLSGQRTHAGEAPSLLRVLRHTWHTHTQTHTHTAETAAQRAAACRAGVRHQPQQQLSSPRVIRTTAHHRPVLPAARRVDLPVRTHCSVSVTETMTAEQPSTSRRTPEKRSGLAGRVASIRNIRDLSESHQPVKKGKRQGYCTPRARVCACSACV